MTAFWDIAKVHYHNAERGGELDCIEASIPPADLELPERVTEAFAPSITTDKQAERLARAMLEALPKDGE